MADRWISLTLSGLLHAGIVGVLVFGWWQFKHRPQPEVTPVIDATVVSDRSTMAQAAAPKPQPAPVPPPPAPVPASPPAAPPAAPPPPQPDSAQVQHQQEQAASEAEARRQAEQQAKQQRQAEAKRQAEAQRKAQQAAQQAAQAKAQAARVADLQSSLAAEEKADAARNSPAMANWQQLIQARIERAWIRPPSAHAGLDCIIDVTQVQGGTVTAVHLGSCNGDAAVRQSIEDAVSRASPLPPPPDPSLFVRDLEIEFKPLE